MTDGADPGQPPPGPATDAEGATPVDYEPPWREAWRRTATAWRRGGLPTRILLAVALVAGAALLGAFLFGLWHVVVGGFVNGNWNAAGFGFALAGVTGVLLWIEASVARRILPA